MKIHIDIKTMLTGLFVLLLVLPFASCDNDDNGGQPVIHDVRTTDPEKKDSTFVQGTPGQMLLIDGENLGSARKIYINNQEVYFNPNYVTSKNIILSIPATLELTGINPELPKEIRVETDGGTAIFSFHVLSPAPSIKRLLITYPVSVGDLIVIDGANFYEIQKIVMEGNEGANMEITQYTVSQDYAKISFRLPAGVDKEGELAVYCDAGEARSGYATFVLPPVINTISSTMPIIGAEFFIAGNYYINVVKVNINGEYDIEADDLRVSESNDTIYLKLPVAPAASGKITITAGGGSTQSTQLFYPIEYVIADFDTFGSNSWTGNLYQGNGTTPPYQTTGKAIGIIEKSVGPWNYWFGNVLSNIVFRDAIPDNTLVTDLVVRFECFLTFPLSTIKYEVMFGGDWSKTLNGYVPVSIASGKTEIGKWMSCEIPLSMIINRNNYSEVKVMGKEFGFYSKNASSEIIPLYEVYFDNMRLMPKVIK